MYGIVYLLTSPSGKYYIGQTTRSLEERWKQHLSPSNARCLLIHRAIFKYGPDSFHKDIIAEAESKERLDHLEKFWIKMFQSNNPEYGYNLREGGSGGKLSEETKRKISEANSGNQAWLGKHHSDATKEKISAARKGKKMPPRSKEHRDKMSRILKGRVISPETRQKLSESMQGRTPWNKGVPMPEEARQHLSENFSGENASWFGRKHTEEQKQKISEAHKGMRPSEETIKKLSEARKAWWAAKKAEAV